MAAQSQGGVPGDDSRVFDMLWAYCAGDEGPEEDQQRQPQEHQFEHAMKSEGVEDSCTLGEGTVVPSAMNSHASCNLLDQPADWSVENAQSAQFVVGPDGGVVVPTYKRRATSPPGDFPQKYRATESLVNWRKYGQKNLKTGGGTGNMVRCYFRCTSPGCPVKKQTEMSVISKQILNTTITGVHNHALEQTQPRSRSNTSMLPAESTIPDISTNFVDMMMKAHPHFVVCDPNVADCPIVFASSGFLSLTGFSLAETVGRNCRFVQGKDTNSAVKRQLRVALQDQQEIHVVILNYKKNGTPFWNLLHMSPIITSAGVLQSYVGSQLDVSHLVKDKDQGVIDTNGFGELSLLASHNRTGL